MKKLIPAKYLKILSKISRFYEQLKREDVIRSDNTITSDLGEYVCRKLMKLRLAPNSNKGYDAIKSSRKYQIKTRRMTRRNSSKQLGSFRDLKKRLFDYCLIVLLNKDYDVIGIWQATHAQIVKHAKKTTRGYMRVVFSRQLENESKKIYPI